MCEKHNFEFVTKHKELKWTNKDGTEEKWTQQWVLYVPQGEGPGSTMNIATTREATGKGGDRSRRQRLAQLNSQIAAGRGGKSAAFEYSASDAAILDAIADAAESRKCVQQMAEESSPGESSSFAI